MVRVLPVLLAAALVLAGSPAAAATIVIVNGDAAGEGFNDPTPASPVGGNPGTTLGAQRLNVFHQAAGIWGALLESNVTIRVEATFDPLDCGPGGAVLGSAGPRLVFRDFPNAPFQQTWFHAALANKLAGQDLASQTDILCHFNSTVDDASCLGSSDWYYGFDHDHGSDFDLLAVVLHELAHGLGFSTLIDVESGAEFPYNQPALGPNRPDLFSRFILDAGTGKHWHEMTDSERRASTTATGQVVWDGAAVTREAPGRLVGAPRVSLNSPAPLAGDLAFVLADFAPPPRHPGVTADVALASPANGCGGITNGAAIAGRIALVDRGGCTFSEKARHAAAAGAVGVMVANNQSGLQGMTGSAPSLAIPVVGITQADGNAIKAALAGGVNATIAAASAPLSGLHANGRLLLYTPNPVERGSSVSHWDVRALPNLLMEPVITDRTGISLDVTVAAFEDLGWLSPGGSGTPSLPPLVQFLGGGPNPFGSRAAPSTSISFQLERAASVEIAIHDLTGRRARRLFEGPLAAGTHAATWSWNGSDDDGRPLDPGVYWVRVHSGKESATRKVALVR